MSCMYAGGWTGGFLRHEAEGGGERGGWVFFTGVTHDEADFFFYSVWEEVGGGWSVCRKQH